MKKKTRATASQQRAERMRNISRQLANASTAMARKGMPKRAVPTAVSNTPKALPQAARE